jgi:hypothetical protein
MFEKIAKFRLLRTRRTAPDRSAAANDNRRGAVQPGRRRPQLICRWSFDQGPSCRWEVAGPQGGDPLLADEPPAGRIHTTVFVLSYDGRARSGQATRSALIAPNLLQARH